MATEKVLIFCVLLSILEEMVYNTRYMIFVTINDRLSQQRNVTFLSLNKKVTKEISTGEALGANAPSPVYPSRRTFERVPLSIHLRTDGRKSAHFRLIVKVLGPVCFRRGGT
jgi:hypothetical protein